MKNYKIAVIKGDGIGPEIINEAVKVLKVVGEKFSFRLDFEDYLMGGIAYDLTGNPLPNETIEGCLKAVIAKSYARIFYRNAFNTGLPILEIKETDLINEGDVLEIDLKAGIIHNQTQKTQYHFTPIPPFMLELLECGGLIPYAKTQKGNQNEKL